ncbi:MAG: hypothetical protein OXI96_01045 [Acidimicrobiaceae bacterium]|nr:hypothetical protein [Acidimicrobiaceae bacterium]
MTAKRRNNNSRNAERRRHQLPLESLDYNNSRNAERLRQSEGVPKNPPPPPRGSDKLPTTARQALINRINRKSESSNH